MNLRERKAKYDTKPKRVEGIKFNFDLTMMNTFCSYCLSENTSVHRNSLINLRSVFNKIEESMFENMQECITRFRFCKKVLEAKLDKKLYKRELVLRDVYGVVGSAFESLDQNNFCELANDDVRWIEDTIASCMDVIFINNKVSDLQYVCTEYANADYTNKMEVVTRIKNQISDIQTQFRRNDIDRDTSDQMFRLSKSESAVADLHARKKRPSYKLITGMQGFNDMLGGGFSGGAVYCILGLPGEGKTVTLLNLLYQLKKYNKSYICKDKTKRPCIVLLTMENQVQDGICTLFNIACSTEDISNYTTEEALQLMMARELAVTMDSPIDIIIKYKPINSVDTNYLYKLTEDLEDEGYEVIALLQDYIKRIKPMDENKEERFRLGNVINDFRNFAIYKDIPVITASQLNRDAARIIDDSRDTKKNDLVRKLGRANIGESSLIDENLDGTLFITPEWVGDRKYMGIKLTKHRYKIYTKIKNIYQPFEEGNEVKLMEDEGLTKPLFKESLVRDGEEIKKAFGDTVRFSVNREIRDIDELEADESKVLTGGTVYGELKNVAYTQFKESVFKSIVERVPVQPQLTNIVTRVKVA
jgi:archaellum biogenesis ATPase FlaH